MLKASIIMLPLYWQPNVKKVLPTVELERSTDAFTILSENIRLLKLEPESIIKNCDLFFNESDKSNWHPVMLRSNPSSLLESLKSLGSISSASVSPKNFSFMLNLQSLKVSLSFTSFLINLNPCSRLQLSMSMNSMVLEYILKVFLKVHCLKIAFMGRQLKIAK